MLELIAPNKLMEWIESVKAEAWKEYLPPLSIEICGGVEHYQITYSNRTLKLKASDPYVAAYAIRKLAKSYLPEEVGEHLPRFQYRILCLKEWTDDAYSIGYNKFLPFDEKQGSFYWQSKLDQQEYYQRLEAKDALLFDLVLEEISQVASEVFAIPGVSLQEAKFQCDWLLSLTHEVGDQIMLSFPAFVEGQLHPFWECLRQSFVLSSTPLLPRVSAERVSEIVPLCKRHPFTGIIVDCETIDEHVEQAAELLWGE